jgi:DNA repair exonuclease SbcCD nuclease subunit
MKPFSILHISDLHRSPHDPISNEELLSALVSDRDRYTREDPPVAAPGAIVVSGDLIHGVRLGVGGYEAALAAQYEVAAAFLEELVRRFLDGDRSRVVIVPGNHDVDWNTAFAAMTPVADSDVPSDLEAALFRDGSEYRWNWKTRTLYRITNPDLYEQRLQAFWRFFRGFYEGVPGLLRVHAGADANLFSLCDGRIGVAAFNSCHDNDCFERRGMIRREAVARTHLDLNDVGRVFDLRMAVWHHSIEGPPHRMDYMDVEIVRGMIGRGFRLGLYGHQHRTQVVPHQVWLPDRERMAVVSAGSLCAGGYDLPTGTYRQYNILEIAADFKRVRAHVREMAVANLFSRGRLAEFGGLSYADLDWEPPRDLAGGRVDIRLQRTRLAIEEAEAVFKAGNAGGAVALLRDLDLPPNSYQRQLFLAAATAAGDWGVVSGATNPPTNIEELVQRVEACARLRDFTSATATLDEHAGRLHLPGPQERELRQRLGAQQGMQR